MDAVDRLDAGILHVEKAVVAGILATMGFVVFLDVMHRMGSGAGWGYRVAWLVAAPVLGAAAAQSRKPAAPAALGAGIGLVVAVAHLVFPMVVVNGLVWSQPFALALTLWLGTIGASIAAHQRRHLAMDIGSKLWPAWLAPKMAALGHLVTAVFCLGLLYLSGRSLFGFELEGQHVPGYVEVWQSSGGTAATLSGTAIPKWMAVAAIPYGMAMLGFRFGLDAIRSWRGQIQADDDDTLRQLGIEEPVAGTEGGAS